MTVALACTRCRSQAVSSDRPRDRMLPLRHGMIIQIPPRAVTAQPRPVPQTVRLVRPGHEAGISVPGCHSRSWESVVPGPASVPKRETQHAQGIRPQGVLVEPGRQPERARQIAAEYLDPQHRVCGGQPHAQQPRHTGHRRSPTDQPEPDAVRGLGGGRRASTAETAACASPLQSSCRLGGWRLSL